MHYGDLYIQAKLFYKMAEETLDILPGNLYKFVMYKTQGKITPEVADNFVVANKTTLSKLKFVDWSGNFEKNGSKLFGEDGDGERYMISTESTPPKNSHVKQSYILQGKHPIPTFYIFRYERGSDVEFPKELGHYLFLMPALCDMFDVAYPYYFQDPDHMNDFVEFVQKNKAKIDSIRSRFQHEPKPLGSGSDGFVFAIGKDRILKIFKQQFSYQAAKESANRIWKQHGIAGTEAYIDDIGQIGNFGEHPVYYYIQERMETVFNFLKNDVDFNGNRRDRKMSQITDFMKDIAKTIKNDPNYPAIYRNKNNPRIGNAIRSLAERVYNRIVYFVNEEITDDFAGKLQPDWMLKLIEEMAGKLITDRMDLRSYNVGITGNGYLRFFDPAFDPKEL